jgi:cytochrome c oxidase assembly protein subunit 15
LLLAAAVLQVTLGISTLLLHVPVTLAAAHQGGALVLLTAMLFVNHRMRRQ